MHPQRVSILTAALIVTAGAVPAATGKGPVGWEVYRQLDRLPELTSGVKTLQFSSYDRTGGNNDGFEGTWSCLETTTAGCVIARETGAGEIQSIWFTRDGGDVSKTGNITITLDGKVVLDAPLQKVVDGELGAPFAFPFVANASQSSGGVYIKVPMPYRESMIVTVQNNPLFYHVSYRKFADAEGVTTFDPAEKAEDVIAQWRAAGTRDPKPSLPQAATRGTSFSLAAGETTTVAQVEGPGVISALRIRIPQVVGPQPGPPQTETGRAFGAGGFSQFTAKIDPDHTGVRLIRHFDDHIEFQHSRILIDGQFAEHWHPIPSNRKNEWRDQVADIPTSVTRGKSSITVRNEFGSSKLDFNEFVYWVESKVDGEWKRTDTIDVGSIESEKAHDYKITGETWSGERTFNTPLTGDPVRIAASDEILSTTRLRITFDGKPTVDSPLGEFFGSGLGEYEVRALMYGIDPSEGGWYSSWWPMPYSKSARIELVNESGHDITSGEVEVTSAKDERRGSMPHFHATTHRGFTEDGKDWVFLDTQSGPGKFVGVTHTMMHENERGYLEGDERVYVDDETSPSMHGTGTEDFYEGGWYFNRESFTLPTNGNPVHENRAHGTPGDATGCYRLMIGDQVPFSSSLRFSIEHGPANDWPGWYSSTSYWYSPPEAANSATAAAGETVGGTSRKPKKR